MKSARHWGSSRSRLWVSAKALTRAVAELRRALSDEAQNPRYIETIPKRGYRLVAEVDRAVGDSRSGRGRPWAKAARLGLPVVAALVLAAGIYEHLAAGRRAAAAAARE